MEFKVEKYGLCIAPNGDFKLWIKNENIYDFFKKMHINDYYGPDEKSLNYSDLFGVIGVIDEFMETYTNVDYTGLSLNEPKDINISELQFVELCLDLLEGFGIKIDYGDEVYKKESLIDFQALLELCHIDENEKQVEQYKHKLLIYLLEKRCNIAIPRHLRTQRFYDDMHKKERFEEKLSEMGVIKKYFYNVFKRPSIDSIEIEYVKEIEKYLLMQNKLYKE